MKCFDNYIGIKSCDVTTSASGKYLEDIGISIVKLANISNEATLTGLNYGNQKIKEAIDFVLADTMTEYTENAESGTIGEFTETPTTYQGSMTLRTICRDTSIRIDKVKFNVVTDIDTTLYIKDGSTITEYQINTADELHLNYKSKNSKIELYINDVNYVPLSNGGCGCEHECCKKIDVQNYQNGLEVDYSLVCDLACKLSNNFYFQNAVLYYCGVLISQDQRTSEKTNESVRFASDKDAVEREDIWLSMYEKYASKVRTLFTDIIKNSCCKQCETYSMNYKF